MLRRLAFAYLGLVALVLLGLPPLAESLGLEPMFAFRTWATVLTAAWWVTWFGVALVFYAATRPAGVSWIAVGLILGAVSGGLASHLGSYPPLTIISNDLPHSPSFFDEQGELSAEDRALHERTYSHLKPLVLTGTFEEIWSKLLQALGKTPDWDLVHHDRDLGKLQVEARDRLFGFTDQMVIELTSVSESVQSLRVSMRSELDLGAGARRLNRLAELLKGF